MTIEWKNYWKSLDSEETENLVSQGDLAIWRVGQFLTGSALFGPNIENLEYISLLHKSNFNFPGFGGFTKILEIRNHKMPYNKKVKVAHMLNLDNQIDFWHEVTGLAVHKLKTSHYKKVEFSRK